MPAVTQVPIPEVNGLTAVSRYQRRMPVSLKRMYENALDWEHLPHLHSDSFTYIDCLDSGDWGWRAKAGLAQTKPPVSSDSPLPTPKELFIGLVKAMLSEPLRLLRYMKVLREQTEAIKNGADVSLELTLDVAERRWITKTLEGPGQGSEVWTTVIEHAEQDIEVVVDFLVPGVPKALIKPVGQYYRLLYSALYDEDERMMATRQVALDAVKSRTAAGANQSLNLGNEDQLKASLPNLVDFDGRQWRLVLLNDEIVAHSALCPHMLGPLDSTAVSADGVIACPWHDYRFDVRTGENLSGQKCRLLKAPSVVRDGQGEIFLFKR